MKPNLLRYRPEADVATACETLEIFLACGAGYVRYAFVHTCSADINSDCWRIHDAVYVDADLAPVKVLTTPGDWELAVHLAGRDDFSGGAFHGDELMDAVHFFADGIPVDVRALGESLAFEELVVVERSRLLDPADHVTLIADHGKEYRFSRQGLTLSQCVDWRVSEVLTRSYLAMFPVSKEVTTHFYTNRDFLPRPIVYGPISGVTEAVSCGPGFFGRFAVKAYPKHGEDCTYLITDNKNGAYNKQYFYAANDGDRVEAGDRWYSVTEYALRYEG